MVKKLLVLIFLFGTLAAFAKPAAKWGIKSPDGKVRLDISLVNNQIHYKVNWAGEEMVGLSKLAIFSDAEVKIVASKVTDNNHVWKPVWEQFSSIADNYKQLELVLEVHKVKGKLYARAYNEGVAFRFILEEGAKPAKANYFCHYTLPKESRFFAPNKENEPWGPLSIKGLNDHQLTASKDGQKKNIQMPLVVETSNHSFMALLESDLFAANGFDVMQISVDDKGEKIVSNNPVQLTNKELTTPWRVILLGKSAGDLVVNTLTQNLATPCQIENTDWIKSGKCLWDFRVNGYVAPDGFKYGINTESYLRFIDFAAEKGIEYFMIDAFWYTKATKGHFDVTKNLDLQKVTRYAKEKKVEIILYYDNKQGEYGDDELFPYFQSLGMGGMKYGFMGPNVPFTTEAIRKSAERQLLIDFHDSPVPMTGVHRTYPNAITREYCHAQQDSRKAFTPESFIKMALINAVTGPLDMNNGNFDIKGINSGSREKSPKQVNSYFSTVVSEAARTLIIFSGLVCLPDAPEAYQAKADLFEFIQKLPVGKWDESRILNAKMGQYMTTARRHNKEWFVGSVINQQGGSIDITLDFLDKNQEYAITFYEDTDKTDCKTNPEAYQIRKGIVKKGETIKAQLASGGGHCMWIRPLEKSKASSSETVNFSYSEVTGIGKDVLYNRRDNSDIIKVGNKYYIWYTRMNSPTTSGYWGTIWYATSEDEGHTWKEQGMALSIGKEGAFDSHSVFTPNILAHKGKYYLYYTGVKPTPNNPNKVFENNSTNDITAIGLAVSNSPDGPFERVVHNPVLEISSDSAAFDSYRIDDASLLVRGGKIWLYYKGRCFLHGKDGAKNTQMGVAYANQPEGPYVKHKGPILDKSHEVLIWSQGGGVASLASISSTINFAKDGVHFSTLKSNLEQIPKAPGLYRPHLEFGHKVNEIPGWGIAMKVEKSQAYLVRFEMK